VQKGGIAMHISQMLAALVSVACFSAPVAADLSKIDRAIVKEPAYKGKPRYCLLVFGPQAKTRAWLVLDDDSVYISRRSGA
jgi:hypothetical protein